MLTYQAFDKSASQWAKLSIHNISFSSTFPSNDSNSSYTLEKQKVVERMNMTSEYRKENPLALQVADVGIHMWDLFYDWNNFALVSGLSKKLLIEIWDDDDTFL